MHLQTPTYSLFGSGKLSLMKANLFKGKLILSETERQARIMSLLIDGVCQVNTVDLYKSKQSQDVSSMRSIFKLISVNTALVGSAKDHRLLICLFFRTCLFFKLFAFWI